MKRMLNTLYVMTQSSYIHKDGEALVVRVETEDKVKIPIITIKAVICFGNVLVTPGALELCTENDVTVTYLSYYGRFMARIQGRVSGNVLLRKEQYRMSDDIIQSARIARNIVSAKVHNSRLVLSRGIRDHGDKIEVESIEKTVAYLKRVSENVLEESDLDKIRGIEGEAAKEYFSHFNALITNQKSDFFFIDRNRRPPRDRINALLSLTYTLLYHDMRSACEMVGLDPAVGFLHRDRPGRYGLALDLMEEFRSFIADRLVLSLVNLKQVSGNQFDVSESGAVLMDDDARKVLLGAYQKKKQDSLTHFFLDEEMHIGLMFHAQAVLFARFLRGDIDEYPAYMWR